MTDLSIVVIIPLYNGAQWIEETIRSVFAQTLQPDELIVVDDGSTDEGPAIVERLGVKLLRKPNGGQSSARNYGVAYSKSALIALLDQDDIWYPRHLETLVRPFCKDRDSRLGWAYSNIDTIDEKGRLLVRRYLDDLPMEHPKRHLTRCLGEDMHVLPGASLISRAAFDSVGGFDERLSGYEDDDLFLRLFAANYDNVFIDEPLTQWRMVANSSGHSPRMLDSGLIYMDKLVQSYPEHAAFFANRFLHAGLCRYATFRKAEHRDKAMRMVRQVAPLLSMKRRLLMKLVLPLLRFEFTARAMFAARPVIKKIYRAIFAYH